MHKGHPATSIFLITFLIILQPIRTDASEWITKQNQADQDCSLTVDVDVKVNADLEIDWIKFTVTIPKDDKRLEQLFGTRFLLGTSGSTWTWRVIIPIKPSETINSSKTFEVNVHRSELHNSYVEFNRRWQDQTLSSNDVSYLKL